MFRKIPKGWDGLSSWYSGMVGQLGSAYHQRVAVPLLMSLANIKKGDRILDIGCGNGFLAKKICELGGSYTGIDASRNLLSDAVKYSGKYGRFIHMDAGNIKLASKFSAGLFLLSIADMDPLANIARTSSAVIEKGGRICIVMLHPAFRIQRQSGWGMDMGRKLRYRRVDSYLSELDIPLKPQKGGGVSVSFHRPISTYINEFTKNGMYLTRMEEVPFVESYNKTEKRSEEEIPLLLGMRFEKLK